jgi:hypothetical protein
MSKQVFGSKLTLLCGLAAVGLAAWLLGERRAWSGVDHANKDLRLQLSQMDALLADNRRLLALVPESGPSSPPNQGSDSVAAMTEPAKELIRLRGEVEVLREESKAIQTLREDTRQTRAAVETAAQNTSSNRAQRQNSASDSSGSKLQILRAVYGTDNAQLDVTDELQDRIRGDQLKAIASNNIKGDPEFGQVKHLTIEYSYGGVTFTNQFTENAFVQLPPPDTQ